MTKHYRYSVVKVSNKGLGKFHAEEVYSTDSLEATKGFKGEPNYIVIDNGESAYTIECDGEVLGYLSEQDVEDGVDILMDMKGFELVSM